MKVIATRFYETLPNVIVIIDRFHVAKNYRACADKARKETMHTLKKTLSDQDTAKLKGAIWVFRKRWQDLSIQEQIILLTLRGIKLFEAIQNTGHFF